MAAFQNPSETAKGKAEEFYLQLARGHIANHYHIHKFGSVPEMANGTTGTIWDVNDTLYPWSALNTPAVVNINRASASDNGLVVTVQGLDSDWKEQSENILITGENQSGTKLWRRVNRAFISSLTASTNIGNINIQAATAGGTTVARITAGEGQTLMAVYTIPAGKNGYLVHGTASCQAGADATGRMLARFNTLTSVFRIGHIFEVSGAGGQYDYTFQAPLFLPEKTDIDVRASVRTNKARVTAAFDVILIDDNN
jgi:hypothetical protein